jgi:hypothetical protein
LTEKQIGLYGRQVCELNRHVQQPPSLPKALPRVVPWGLLLRVERSSRTPKHHAVLYASRSVAETYSRKA